jgi:hypothetical protein
MIQQKKDNYRACAFLNRSRTTFFPVLSFESSFVLGTSFRLAQSKLNFLMPSLTGTTSAKPQEYQHTKMQKAFSRT